MTDLRTNKHWRALAASMWGGRGLYGWTAFCRSGAQDRRCLDNMVSRSHVEENRGLYRLTNLGRKALGLEEIPE